MPPKSGTLREFIAQVVRDAAPDALSLDEVLLRVANAGFESSIRFPKETKNNATSILKSNRGKLFHESWVELDEEIKEIVETIIKEHLGWLVVWGGVFGGFPRCLPVRGPYKTISTLQRNNHLEMSRVSAVYIEERS